MKRDLFIAEIIKRTGLSKEDIEVQIEQKKEKYYGCLDTFGDPLFRKIITDEYILDLWIKELEQDYPFEDNYRVDVKYSCEYRIAEGSNEIQCKCRFHDFIPLSRISDYIQDIVHKKMQLNLEIDIKKAWCIPKSELEDLFDSKDRLANLNYPSCSIVTGFTTSIIKDNNSSIQEIDDAIRSWIRDLVEYIIAPRVKIEQYNELNIITDIKPINFFKMRPPNLAERNDAMF